MRRSSSGNVLATVGASPSPVTTPSRGSPSIRLKHHQPTLVPPLPRRFSLRPQSFRFVLLVSLSGIGLLLVLVRLRAPAAPPSVAPSSSSPSKLSMPNFDFDMLFRSPRAEEPEEADDEDAEAPGVDATDEEGVADTLADVEAEKEAVEDDDLAPFSDLPLDAAPTFLPYTCAPSSSIESNDFPTYTKYAASKLLDPAVLDRAVVFAGSGSEVRRVLKRAAKSSLYAAKRRRENDLSGAALYEDEESFQVLVLGGSVSNCRGVTKFECWHSRLEDWFHRTVKLEGDPKQRLSTSAWTARGPSRLNVRSMPPVPVDDEPPSTKVKREGLRKSSKKKQKGPPKTASGRLRPRMKVFNSARSATGSAYFAHCLDAELKSRGISSSWGPGPDLVVLEFGVNDVFPTTEAATKDFEKLLFHLRSMASKPAIVILEAASLLLAQISSTTTNAEYLHLPAAHFHDIPVLSTKMALFGPMPAFLPTSSMKMEDIFLTDLHHFNNKGHEFLADVLGAYLERQLCHIQGEVLQKAKLRSSETESLVIEPELDFVPRKEEVILPLPARSLFTPFSSRASPPFAVPPPVCLQIGHTEGTIEPIRNNGWTKYSWARDKQYLVADKPGATVTYEVTVGPGGEVLVDWLRSRFYDLGNVIVFLDNKKSKGVVLAGYWDLGWSIGVPTAVFTRVSPGLHTVSFELLPASKSSHPAKKTNFRLIGLITS